MSQLTLGWTAGYIASRGICSSAYDVQCFRPCCRAIRSEHHSQQQRPCKYDCALAGTFLLCIFRKALNFLFMSSLRTVTPSPGRKTQRRFYLRVLRFVQSRMAMYDQPCMIVWRHQDLFKTDVAGHSEAQNWLYPFNKQKQCFQSLVPLFGIIHFNVTSLPG